MTRHEPEFEQVSHPTHVLYVQDSVCCLGFFDCLTQAGVVWEEGTLNEKINDLQARPWDVWVDADMDESSPLWAMPLLGSWSLASHEEQACKQCSSRELL